MLFNSWAFAAFLAVTFVLYYSPPVRRFQVPFLVTASFLFYGHGQPALLLLLAWSIAVNAATSTLVARTSGSARLGWASFGVAINLAVLATFKYGSLFAELFFDAATRGDSRLASLLFALPLPVGISFYTFEGISLLVDVLRSRRDDRITSSAIVNSQSSVHVARTALFISFFPHLAAGPILKARHFFPQVGPKDFQAIRWEPAFRALVTGFFLKMFVADNLNAQTIALTYPYYRSLSLSTAATLVFGYSIQIFADFAGYSLIAIGLAELFGYRLPENFRLPYISRSLAEFWRRWHISLSTWLRDYLYISLGGNRRGPVRTYFNLFAVMVLGGFWHGAAWSYAIWGAYHGAGLVLERLLRSRRETPAESQEGVLRTVARTIAVFLFVTIGWLLFKFPEFQHLREFIGCAVSNRSLPLAKNVAVPVLLFSSPVIVYHALGIPYVRRLRARVASQWPRASRFVLASAYGSMLAMSVLNYGTASAFIYFQF